MIEISSLHDQAMDIAEAAFDARRRSPESARALFRQALELEAKAAMLLADQADYEPTRSVVFRSAASLALNCGDLPQARRLAIQGISGNPPREIADELGDIFQQANQEYHLSLQGIALDPCEMQMSLAGNMVGSGVIPSELFLDRVQNAEKLLIRTAERCKRRPFRSRGRATDEVRNCAAVYLSVPRAASFAVTFRVGLPREQLVFDNMNEPACIIDELMDCLQIYKSGSRDQLRHRIPDDSYYNNFVALAKQVAPDGDHVSLVGFTAYRDGNERHVALTDRLDMPPAQVEQGTSSSAKPVSIEGVLRHASALDAESKIKIVKDDGRAATVYVAEWMMDDIVRPLWDERVVMQGYKTGRKTHLSSIAKAPQSDRT